MGQQDNEANKVYYSENKNELQKNDQEIITKTIERTDFKFLSVLNWFDSSSFIDKTTKPETLWFIFVNFFLNQK